MRLGSASAKVCAFMIANGLLAATTHANKMAECEAGMEKVRAHIEEFRAAKKYCREYKPPSHLSQSEQDEKIWDACSNPACLKMNPSAGARACLEARKRYSGARQRKAARFYKRIFKYYKACDVQ